MKKVLLVLFILSICFVSSTHSATISTGASYYSKIQNESLPYNISISNTEAGQNANITQVKITLPDSFAFEMLSQGTSALSTDFTKTDAILTWEDLEIYLINGSETEYFWFKATASLVGDYELLITTININGSDESSISVTVTPAETTTCAPNWICSEWSECINSTQTKNCTDQNNCGNQTSKPIEVQSCSIDCVSNWNCTSWSECADSIQTKTCTDLNNCDTPQEKPITTKTCIQEKKYTLLFIIIVATIILTIVGITIYLIKILKKATPEQN